MELKNKKIKKVLCHLYGKAGLKKNGMKCKIITMKKKDLITEKKGKEIPTKISNSFNKIEFKSPYQIISDICFNYSPSKDIFPRNMKNIKKDLKRIEIQNNNDKINNIENYENLYNM